jgi:hypothetical protein
MFTGLWAHVSRVAHVSYISVKFNSNLDGGGTRHAIQSNWGVNCSNWKFGGTLKKGSKFGVVKCHFPNKIELLSIKKKINFPLTYRSGVVPRMTCCNEL